MKAKKGEEKSTHHHRGNPLFFLFRGLRPLWGIPFFPDLWRLPFSLAFPGKWYTPLNLFFLCDLGVWRQAERGGVPQRWWFLFFSLVKKRATLRVSGKNRRRNRRDPRDFAGWHRSHTGTRPPEPDNQNQIPVDRKLLHFKF